MSRPRIDSSAPMSPNPCQCARQERRRERLRSNPPSMKRPNGWGSTRLNFACVTLPIVIRKRGVRGAATACLNAIASAPNGSAGRRGRRRASPPTDVGGSVGAWQARFIRRSVRPAGSASSWRRTPRCAFNAAHRTWAPAPTRRWARWRLARRPLQVTVELGDTLLPEGPFSGVPR